MYDARNHETETHLALTLYFRILSLLLLLIAILCLSFIDEFFLELLRAFYQNVHNAKRLRGEHKLYICVCSA